MPSGFLLRDRSRGRRETTGTRRDLMSDVEERCCLRKTAWPRAGDVRSTVCGPSPVGDGGAEACKDGSALSFALKLKNKNSGTNQTQIAKNAATSMKAGSSTSIFPPPPTPPPYRYFGPLNFFASCAFDAKWKNHVKWSATTRMQDRMNRGDVREMYGHVEEKFWR